jgi:hypothetical protein
MPDNDPFFQSTYATEGTSRLDLIVNEHAARVYASLGALKGVDVNDPPPGSPYPDDYDAYLIGPAPTGAWVAAPGYIAVWLNGWKYLEPKDGMRLLVADDVNPGGVGRYIEYSQNGWSSLGGEQTIVPVNVSGTWTVRWDHKYGSLATVILDQATVVFDRPTNVRYGRPFALQVKQDITGSRLIQLKPSEWLVPTSLTQPTTTPLSTTIYTFIWTGPGVQGPALVNVALNLVSS